MSHFATITNRIMCIMCGNLKYVIWDFRLFWFVVYGCANNYWPTFILQRRASNTILYRHLLLGCFYMYLPDRFEFYSLFYLLRCIINPKGWVWSVGVCNTHVLYMLLCSTIISSTVLLCYNLKFQSWHIVLFDNLTFFLTQTFCLKVLTIWIGHSVLNVSFDNFHCIPTCTGFFLKFHDRFKLH